MTRASLRQHGGAAWACPGQAVPHSPRNGAVTMTGEGARPLIQSREQMRQAERGRRQGPLPVRAETPSGSGRAATRARPGGVALDLTEEETEFLLRVLERHLKAARSSLAFWKHEMVNHGVNPPFNLDERARESEFVLRLYLALHDVTNQPTTKADDKATEQTKQEYTSCNGK